MPQKSKPLEIMELSVNRIQPTAKAPRGDFHMPDMPRNKSVTNRGKDVILIRARQSIKGG
jgi:hypothetical protein